MTIPASQEFDPTSTLSLWLAIDDSARVAGWTDSWATSRANQWQSATGAEPEIASRVRTFLTRLVDSPRPAGYAWRLVFLLDPDFGATVVDVALVEAMAGPETAALLAGEDGAVGWETTFFQHGAYGGQQGVRFDLEGSLDDPERAVSAAATVIVTRNLAPYGPVTLVARALTTHLDAMATALLPLQHLLCSQDFLEVVLPD